MQPERTGAPGPDPAVCSHEEVRAMGVVDDLVRARETFERGDWAAAFEAWTTVAPDALAPEDLAEFATAAFLLGRREVAVQALQRAFGLQVAADDTRAAVLTAFRLCMTFDTGGEHQVAAGWAARAQRLVEQVDGEAVERGYVAYLQMHQRIATADWAGAALLAGSVVEHGRRHGDPDLTAIGLASLGRLSIYSGRVPEGLALFDEAMVGVASGEVGPIFAGNVYCVMVEGCQEISDLGRASAWTAALTRWCAAQPGLVTFTGQCAVHRGQIMRLHGDFARAIEEYDAAVERYLAADTPEAAGLALAERGDVLRIMGDLDAAEASYDRAADRGFEPQPGLALLWSARGRDEAASAAIRRLLAETPDPVHRSRLLEAAVEILLGTDPEEARGLAVELEQVAADFGCEGLQAMAAHCLGRVERAAGDASGALPYLRKAAALWGAINCPYEVARVDVQVGLALRQLGDVESATRALTHARRTFVELGARDAAEATSRLLEPAGLPDGLTGREVEVLRLVAAGRSNAQIAAELVLSEKTVARHLSNIFTKVAVGSRTAAAAYAFEHHLV
ncbi:LuxR family transcriptional regulator [Nocardioides sp. Root151]|uniref:LuxR family transcriptional regulator n=1 Tax=Nocardioides sp. Root151 TaxID=1736475 RepID=UPI001F3D7EBE|nr:LuxR family transcriptional regulator [Nocardioides sp. Root151]